MTKIYYLQQEVKLNDEIDFKGLKIKLTQEIIDNNPNLFILKEETIFPEYVKCVNNLLLGCKSEIGKTYKTIMQNSNHRIKYGIIDDENKNCYIVYELRFTDFFTFFQPSTKEEYDKQQEQIIINNIIEEAKKKFPVGSKFKKGDIVYSVGKTMGYKDIIYFDDSFNTFYIQCTAHNRSYLISTTIYNFYKNEWLAEPLPNSKSFEDYKQDLLNETPYAYLFTINQKLFYIELLSRIANDLNGDWVYKPGNIYCEIYFNNDYSQFKFSENKTIIYHTIKFKTLDITSKFLNLVPKDILDLIYKS